MDKIYKFGCLANKICVSDMASKGLTENICKNAIGYNETLEITFSMNIENIWNCSFQNCWEKKNVFFERVHYFFH